MESKCLSVTDLFGAHSPLAASPPQLNLFSLEKQECRRKLCKDLYTWRDLIRHGHGLWNNLIQPDLHGDPETRGNLRQQRDWLEVLKQPLSEKTPLV